MKDLFKITATTPNDPPTVGDYDFMAHYTGVHHSMGWSELAPGIRQAAEKFLLDFLGFTFYDELATANENFSTASAKQKTAIGLLKDALAYYTAYHVMPERTAFFTDMGVNQNSPSDGSGQPSNQWSWKNKRWSALGNGDIFLDRLLTFLEKNAADFPTWTGGDAYKSSASKFFRKTSDLDEILDIKGSRRTYMTLLRYLRGVESDALEGVLCEMAGVLETELKEGHLTNQNQKLLVRVRKAVAWAALYDAIPNHRVVLDHDGFKVVSSGDQFDDRRNLTNPNHADAIDALRDQADRKARRAMVDLRDFLNKNKMDYPTWANSPCFSEEVKKTGHSIVASRDRRGGIGIF